MVNSVTDSLLSGLNDQQQSAVLHMQGPMLVLAGAGTGKTMVITRRIANLLSLGVAPEEILAVTFTKKAALEMKQRVQTLLGGELPKLTVCTFHALGHRMLREQRIATDARGSVNVVAANQQRELAEAALRQIDADEELDSWAALRLIGRVKTTAAILGDQTGDELTDAEQLTVTYEEGLRQCGKVDFDDLLVLPVKALQESADLRDSYQLRWKYILVDEYQDTNELQHQLVRLLVGSNENLCVVGDDDQSIYGFRGASAEKMLNFRDEFPAAKIVKLEHNYRSKAEIIGLANSVIERASQRYRKTLRAHAGRGGQITHTVTPDALHESQHIVSCMRSRRWRSRWSDMAVLYRVAADARPLIDQLKKNRIPYHSGGEKNSNRDSITIMTLHRSKGLEFPIVFLPAVEEDTLPHFHAISDGDVEEERRLLYVGITRAKQELVISSCESRHGHARTASRFLTELNCI